MSAAPGFDQSTLEAAICDLEGDVLLLKIAGEPIFDKIGNDWDIVDARRRIPHNQLHLLSNEQATAINRAVRNVLEAMQDVKRAFYGNAKVGP